jgi:hypothetical protein
VHRPGSRASDRVFDTNDLDPLSALATSSASPAPRRLPEGRRHHRHGSIRTRGTNSAIEVSPPPLSAVRQRVSAQFTNGGISRIGILGTPRYSGLMLAARITLAHFSVSSAMNFLNSAGERTSGEPPRSARRAFTFGSARAALISLLSLSMIASGVFRGRERCLGGKIQSP